jgi:hypothetical protein
MNRQTRPGLLVTVELPNGVMLARAEFSERSPSYFWWVKEAVAKHFECDADDVDEIETDEGDRLTVKGQIVGRCYLGAQKHEPVAHLMAAE